MQGKKVGTYQAALSVVTFPMVLRVHGGMQSFTMDDSGLGSSIGLGNRATLVGFPFDLQEAVQRRLTIGEAEC